MLGGHSFFISLKGALKKIRPCFRHKITTTFIAEKVEPADVRVLAGDEGGHEEAGGGEEAEGEGRGGEEAPGRGGEEAAGGGGVEGMEGAKGRGDQAHQAHGQERRGREEEGCRKGASEIKYSFSY